MSADRLRRPDLVGALGWALMVVAGLGSIMAIVNAIVHVGKVGLDEFLQDLLSYYRSFFDPIRELALLLGLPPPPQALLDVAAFYFVGMAISQRLWRAVRHVEEEIGAPPKLRRASAWRVVPYSPALLVSSLHFRKEIALRRRHMPVGTELEARDRVTISLLDKTLVSIALVPVGVVLFFVYNAFKVTS